MASVTISNIRPNMKLGSRFIVFGTYTLDRFLTPPGKSASAPAPLRTGARIVCQISAGGGFPISQAVAAIHPSQNTWQATFTGVGARTGATITATIQATEAGPILDTASVSPVDVLATPPLTITNPAGSTIQKKVLTGISGRAMTVSLTPSIKTCFMKDGERLGPLKAHTTYSGMIWTLASLESLLAAGGDEVGVTMYAELFDGSAVPKAAAAALLLTLVD